jgi:hypothetical protein
MAIEVTCIACGRTMMVKDSQAGKTGLCPSCKSPISVPKVKQEPARTTSDTASAPTERQVSYAKSLGIVVPDGITRRQLSDMIDEEKENAPATESQKAYLRDMGVTFPEDIRLNQISMLLTAASRIRQEVTAEAQQRFEQNVKSAGFAADYLTDDQLIDELNKRGMHYIAFWIDDDEFRYHHSRPIKGRLRWSETLNESDVKYILIRIGGDWAKDIDLETYKDEYDGELPAMEFSVG